MGVGHESGSLAPGKIADVIAVRGDVLRDPALLQSVDIVIKRGGAYADPAGHRAEAFADPGHNAPVTRFILRTLIAALGLWLATEWVDGISVSSATTLILAALLLGVVNAIIKPIASC